MHVRGAIHTPHLAAQLNDFSGLRYKQITPTNIDGFVEFSDRLFVFIETKLPDVAMPRGQRLALERIVDAIAGARRYAIALIAVHENRDGMIAVAACPVVEYRFRGAWQFPREPVTVRDAIDRMLSLCRADGLLPTSFSKD